MILIFYRQCLPELNMYESQVNEYKYEIERIARELQEVKKKYFMQKKKEQQTKYVLYINLLRNIFLNYKTPAVKSFEKICTLY